MVGSIVQSLEFQELQYQGYFQNGFRFLEYAFKTYTNRYNQQQDT